MQIDYVVEQKREAGSSDYLYESLISQGNRGRIIAAAHVHDYVEILYCLSGACRIDQNGIVYHFEAGDMIIIPSQTIHQVASLADGTQYIVVKFRPELIYTTEQTLREFRYALPFLQGNSAQRRLIRRADIESTSLPECFRRIHAEASQKGYGYELAMRAHIFALLSWILRYWKAWDAQEDAYMELGPGAIETLDKVFRYVDAHYGDALNLGDAAKLCAMSPNAFSKFFKKHVNKSFSDYVNLIRIKAAEHMLIFTDLSVTKIAYETGYSSTSYFIQRFSACLGVTPAAFRKRYVVHRLWTNAPDGPAESADGMHYAANAVYTRIAEVSQGMMGNP